MMRRTVPLLVDIRVAALARIGFREVTCGNMSVIGGLCRAGKKWALRSVTFVVHRRRGNRRIFDAVGTFPRHRAQPPPAAGDQRCSQQADRAAKNPGGDSAGEPAACWGTS